MSRIGAQPIKTEGVNVVLEGNILKVSGKKGEININIPENIVVEIEEGNINVKNTSETKLGNSLHGTIRMIIANAVEGVNNGFEKKLELVGVGYRARMEGTRLAMSLGLNHPVYFDAPEGIEIEVPEETKITIRGFDKQKVGEFAAKVRETRKPEPYKGKGIRYEGEYVRRKSSKSGVGA